MSRDAVPSGPPRIDVATDADLDALVRLVGILFLQETDFHPDPAKQRAGIARILAAPDRGRIFAARDAAGAVIGTCCLLFSESTFLGGPVAWLEDVVVHPDHRGQGVGRALVDHAVGFARDAGLLRVSLLTDVDNTPAQTLYASLGFARSTMLPMRRVFADDASPGGRERL